MAEVVRTYYSSGELLSEYFEINGIKYGEEKHYYENGQLERICIYIDGKKNGEEKWYYQEVRGLWVHFLNFYGKKMVNINNIIKMVNYGKAIHILMV